MATPGAIARPVGGGRCGDASAQRQEEATQAAHHLHEPAAAAADQEVPANSVPRSARESRARRVAWTYSDAGQHQSRIAFVIRRFSGTGRALGSVRVCVCV